MRFLVLSLLVNGALFAAEAADFSLAPGASAPGIRTDLPPMTLVVRAEFILQRVRVVSDSRQEETRRDEIRATLKALVTAATGAGIVVRYGHAPVTAETVGEVPIQAWGGRPDVSAAAVELKQVLAENTEVGVVDAVEKLIGDVEPTGRAELVKEAFGIGINDPEKFRYQLLEKVIGDVKRVQGMIGDDYRLKISGLDQRLRWTRHSLKELELYYAYSFTVVPPGEE